jgi:hypothetical protein
MELYKLDFDPLVEQGLLAVALKKLLIRLFAFTFFTFIIALLVIHYFIEQGRIVIMLIIMFPLVLMLSAIVIGLTISSYRAK